MHPFAAVSYDIVFAYAYAVEKLIIAGEIIDGNNMFLALNQTNFEGVTGIFSFDSNVSILGTVSI